MSNSILDFILSFLKKVGFPVSGAIMNIITDYWDWDKLSGKAKSPCYNIGFFGPSRIGKTTLAASMVEEFKQFSSRINSSYLKLSALDDITMTKISGRINDLKAGIEKGTFKTGTLEGTSDHEELKLRFEEGARKSFKQDFILHDFPGGWINDPQKIEQLNLKDWDVIILPIDSVVIMESVELEHKRAARNDLCIDQVENFMRDWVKTRTNLPSLCILAPIKCETYFSTPKVSSMLADKSQLLFNKITNEYYKDVLSIIQSSSSVECLYMPVNTIGCCYLKMPTWENGKLKGVYSISFEPGMNRWHPYGPSYLMLEICMFICSQLRRLPKKAMSSSMESFIQATSEIDKAMRDPDATAPEIPYNRKKILQRGSFK
ncbi:hypothetical protein [uncultured Mailhella sp.]|uniref:TRAFAC clade GTPase domain-containing protein n=1 Tax=uncultured Mailhella sp. TaxID=1981031 RepID=UPI0025CC537A|nr:hypothetical protein [uncultured Mailhella sp.]